MQTDRDAQIVNWIGRIGAAGAEHAMRRFGLSRSVAYDRLGSLVRDELLEHKAVLYARPGMYTASAAGLRWQGSQRLGRCSLPPGGFEHAWQVANENQLAWPLLTTGCGPFCPESGCCVSLPRLECGHEVAVRNPCNGKEDPHLHVKDCGPTIHCVSNTTCENRSGVKFDLTPCAARDESRCRISIKPQQTRSSIGSAVR